VPHPEAAAHALRIDNRHGALATLSGLRTPSSREIWMSLASNRMQYLPIIDLPVIKWPNDAPVAFWVAPNVALTPALRTLGPAAGGLATSASSGILRRSRISWTRFSGRV